MVVNERSESKKRLSVAETLIPSKQSKSDKRPSITLTVTTAIKENPWDRRTSLIGTLIAYIGITVAFFALLGFVIYFYRTSAKNG